MRLPLEVLCRNLWAKYATVGGKDSKWPLPCRPPLQQVFDHVLEGL